MTSASGLDTFFLMFFLVDAGSLYVAVSLAAQGQVPESTISTIVSTCNVRQLCSTASRDPRRTNAQGVMINAVRPPFSIADSNKIEPFLEREHEMQGYASTLSLSSPLCFVLFASNETYTIQGCSVSVLPPGVPNSTLNIGPA